MGNVSITLGLILGAHTHLQEERLEVLPAELQGGDACGLVGDALDHHLTHAPDPTDDPAGEPEDQAHRGELPEVPAVVVGDREEDEELVVPVVEGLGRCGGGGLGLGVTGLGG